MQPRTGGAHRRDGDAEEQKRPGAPAPLAPVARRRRAVRAAAPPHSKFIATRDAKTGARARAVPGAETPPFGGRSPRPRGAARIFRSGARARNGARAVPGAPAAPRRHAPRRAGTRARLTFRSRRDTRATRRVRRRTRTKPRSARRASSRSRPRRARAARRTATRATRRARTRRAVRRRSQTRASRARGPSTRSASGPRTPRNTPRACGSGARDCPPARRRTTRWT